MLLDDLRLQIDAILGAWEKDFKLGEQCILDILFLLMFVPMFRNAISDARTAFNNKVTAPQSPISSGSSCLHRANHITPLLSQGQRPGQIRTAGTARSFL